MPFEADLIYKNRDQIVAAMISAMQARIADIWTEEDGNVRLLFEVLAGEIEGNYLANQLLRDNIFIPTANLVELRRHGETYGEFPKSGTFSKGSLLFTGAGGTVIPIGLTVASDIGVGEIIYFLTTQSGTIPNPGTPGAPTATDQAVGVLPAGTYDYRVTFVTAGGETTMGIASNSVVIAANRQIRLTALPLGGPGTTQRKIYRQVNGGGFKLAATIADNVTVQHDDNNAGPLTVNPPDVGTANRITLQGESEASGSIYNVVVDTITTLVDPPDGVGSVTNTTAFTGGSDEESLEAFRARLLERIRNPQSGSKSDLEQWAESVEGVAEATAFPGDNLGTPTAGHVTVRVVGPAGGIPTQAVLDAVFAELDANDLANITLHVAAFTPVPTNVTADVTLATGFTLADVTPEVQSKIQDYIYSIPVGGTLYLAGLYDAVFGDVAGVTTLVITTPATDLTSTATEKRVPGTISVV
jgi:uncharacterized phage protein gp47/JayE